MEVQQELGCGLSCGSCQPELQAMFGVSVWVDAHARMTPLSHQGAAALHVPGQPGWRPANRIDRVDITRVDGEPFAQVVSGQHVIVQAQVTRPGIAEFDDLAYKLDHADTQPQLVERTYTVIAQSADRRCISLAVRRTPGGLLSSWLLDAPDQLRSVRVTMPCGAGLPIADAQRLVFFAGGIGVTPALLPIQRMAADDQIVLDYSTSTAGDRVFVDWLNKKQSENSGLSIVWRDTSQQARITVQDVIDRVRATRADKYIVCGPKAYVHLVQRGLRRAGVAVDRIHLELFEVPAQQATSAWTFRYKTYLMAALLAMLPLLMLWPHPQVDAAKPHGLANVGHQDLKCTDCHAENPASVRQVMQAKVKSWLGLRQTGAHFGSQPITTNTCTQCHQNPDDRHATNRFLEPRFSDARSAIGAHQCISCHREHNAQRVVLQTTGFCLHCHQDMKLEKDPAQPSHRELIDSRRWNTCLQCHDYHGNHVAKVPERLIDAVELAKIQKYLDQGESPYGATIVKAIKP